MYPLAALILSIVVYGGSLLLGDYPHLAGGAVAFPDYLAHWTGGRMLVDGSTADLFDPRVQGALQAQEVGPDSLSWFVSPPFAALIYAPFALIGFGPSALVWTAFSAACLVVSIRLMKPFAPQLFERHFTQVVIIMASTPPMIELIGSGQDSALALLIWLAGIRLILAGNNVAAGIVFALGLFKPQQFVLVPIVLLIQRRFAALGAWFATASVLTLTSVAIVGADGVVAWVKLPFSDFYTTVVQVEQGWKMQSLPALVTTAFPDSWSGVASPISLLIVLGATLVFAQQLLNGRQNKTPDISIWALSIMVTVVISPHLVLYDLVLVFVPIVYMIEHHNTRALRLSCVALFVLTWTVPLRHVLVRDAQWPLTLIEAAWTAIPLLILWIVLSNALGVRRNPAPVLPRP